MKHVKQVSQTTMTNLPIEKYPLNYKCTHVYDISDKLKEKYGLNLTNLKPDTPTKNEYHDFNFYDFVSKKIQKENTLFPDRRIIEDAGDDVRYEEYTDTGSVVLIPMRYDSSNDNEVHKKQKEEGRNKLINIFRNLYKGDKLKNAIEDIDQHVDFGRPNFEWSNIALDAIYKEYKQYFKNGYLRVWFPYDNDYDATFMFNKSEDSSHGYPVRKLLHLSEIEKYLETNYNLSDELFYQYIINNNYVEGRYWEKPYNLYLEKDKTFTRKGGEYGMDANDTIDKMLSVLEMEFKDIIHEHIKGDEVLEIYIDYYKPIKSKY